MKAWLIRGLRFDADRDAPNVPNCANLTFSAPIFSKDGTILSPLKDVSALNKFRHSNYLRKAKAVQPAGTIFDQAKIASLPQTLI